MASCLNVKVLPYWVRIVLRTRSLIYSTLSRINADMCTKYGDSLSWFTLMTSLKGKDSNGKE